MNFTATLILILIGFVFILIFCILMQKEFSEKKIKKQKEDFKQKQKEQNQKIEEVLNNANKKKDGIHTSNNNAFDNSLNVLQEYAEKLNGNKTDSD